MFLRLGWLLLGVLLGTVWQEPLSRVLLPAVRAFLGNFCGF
mgnify:FL=1